MKLGAESVKIESLLRDHTKFFMLMRIQVDLIARIDREKPIDYYNAFDH